MQPTQMSYRRIAAMALFMLPPVATRAVFAAEGELVAQTPTTRPAAAPEDPGDEMESLIVQALDQKTDLDLKERPISEALSNLSDSTGILIRTEPRTISLLPYGPKTTLTASIKGQPLRESLTALLRPLGLEFLPDRDRLVVRPTPPLRRICRRASWDELATLEKLYSAPWSKELFDNVKWQFQDLGSTDTAAQREALGKLTAAAGEGLAAEVLERACDGYGWSWYPAGQQVVVLPKIRQIERQLEMKVYVSGDQSMSLTESLVDLAQRTGVLLKLDPGVLATLPPELVERFSLRIQNATARQTLELIAGQTGLAYFIEPDGVRLTTNTMNPAATSQMAAQVSATAEATVRSLRSNSIVGEITFAEKDGMSYSFFVREADLPSDVNEMRKARIQEAAEQMRKHLMATGKKEQQN